MRGQCLCGAVAFEIDCERLKLYQCHCSLCRRQSGAACNTATIVPGERFRWLQGSNRTSSWAKPSGFRADFCATCGSPVPNSLRGGAYQWVPAGLLEETTDAQVVAQLCWASRASWDVSTAPGLLHDAVPENFDDFISALL